MSDTETAQPPPAAQNCTFFKKSNKNRGNRGNVRKRNTDDTGDGGADGDDDATSAVVMREKKSKVRNPMIQKSGTVKKSREDFSQDNGSDNEPEELYTSYKSTKSGKMDGPDDMGATATVQIDTELDRDEQAVFERAQAINKETKGKEEDNIYRGQAGYTQYTEKKDTAAGNASSGMVRKGPVRASANLRRTIRWDYEPCICKDWNETGFCGFGDSCKFLHDRTDYKHGWQLDREVEDGRHAAEDVNYEISDDDDDLPFACFICREPFKHPVVTKCKHYFCEQCALKHYKKSKRCFACGEQTFGVFNTAKDIIAKMKKEQEKEEAGDGPPDEEDGDGDGGGVKPAFGEE